jgi:hypothetical protein
MRWKAFVTLQIWFSVTFAVLAVGTVVVVAIGAAPSSQLVTLRLPWHLSYQGNWLRSRRAAMFATATPIL